MLSFLPSSICSFICLSIHYPFIHQCTYLLFLNPSIYYLFIHQTSMENLISVRICVRHWKYCKLSWHLSFWSFQIDNLLIATFKRKIRCHKSPKLFSAFFPTISVSWVSSMCQAQCQYTTGTETENTPALATEERQLTTQTSRSVQTLLVGLNVWWSYTSKS